MKNLILFGRLFLALWFIAIDIPSVDAESCNPLCEFPHMCQEAMGKCLCVVGWTGPDAFYIEGNRVLADYCNQSCHYTPIVKNPECAAEPQNFHTRKLGEITIFYAVHSVTEGNLKLSK